MTWKGLGAVLVLGGLLCGAVRGEAGQGGGPVDAREPARTGIPKGIFGEEQDRQFGRWTLRHDGLEGGTVFEVAYRPDDGNVAFAGTVLGIFRSLDGGRSWQPSRTGLQIQTGGDGIAFSPDDPLEMYVGTLAGPFTSLDGGVTWRPLGTTRSVNGVVVDPNDADHLIAIGPQNPPAYLESFDRGASWAEKSIPVFDDRGAVSAFVFDPTDSRIVYASVSAFTAGKTRGVARSTDGGASWALVNDGLTADSRTARVVDLAIDPADPTRLFAAAACAGVFRTVNSGTTWAPVHDSLCEEDVDVDPADPMRVVSSSGVSLDGGDSWSDSAPGGRFAEAVAIRPGSTTELLAGIDEAGTYRSVDNGGAWQPDRSGLGAGAAMDVAFVGSELAFVAASQTGLFRSEDRGRNWAAVPSPLDVDYYAVVATADPDRLYAGSSNGVVRSTDRGATWQFANAGMEDLDVIRLAVDPTDPQRLFAAVASSGASDLFRSVDGGESWVPTGIPFEGTQGNVLSVAIDPQAPQIIYAGIEERAGTLVRVVFRSTDGGESWSLTDTSINAVGRGGVTALDIDPRNPSTVLLGTVTDGLYRSDDSGGTWVQQTVVPGTIRDIARSPDDPNRIFAGGRLSEDGGLSWAFVGPNFPGGPRVTFVSGRPEVIFNVGFRGVFERRLFEAREELFFMANPNDRFGAAVAATAEFVFVGLPGSDSGGQNAGEVVVYRRSGDAIEEVQRLTAPAGTTAVNFGAAIDVEGDTLLIGAPDPTGRVARARAKGTAGLRAAIFERLTAGWTFRTALEPQGGDANDEFGAAVDFDGQQIVVGAPGQGGGVGAAYRFGFQGGILALPERIDPQQPVSGGRFGQAVSAAAGILAIGQPGSPLNTAIAGSVGLYGIVAGNLAALGAVTPTGGATGDEFGAAVGLQGSALWVGAPGDSDDEGRVFRFDVDDFAVQREMLAATISASGSRFGAALGAAGNTLVVGAPTQLSAVGRPGSAFVYETSAAGARAVDTVSPEPDDELAEFGGAIGIAGSSVVIGAPGTRASSGAALLLFERDVIFANGFEAP